MLIQVINFLACCTPVASVSTLQKAMNASVRNQEYFLQQLEDVERLVSNKERV